MLGFGSLIHLLHFPSLEPGKNGQCLTHQPKEGAMNKLMRALCPLAVSASLVTFIGCKQEGPAEKAGKQVDQAAEKAGAAMKEGAEKVEAAAEQAVEKAKDATK
jgi:hypothetical protein